MIVYLDFFWDSRRENKACKKSLLKFLFFSRQCTLNHNALKNVKAKSQFLNTKIGSYKCRCVFFCIVARDPLLNNKILTENFEKNVCLVCGKHNNYVRLIDMKFFAPFLVLIASTDLRKVHRHSHAKLYSLL